MDEIRTVFRREPVVCVECILDPQYKEMFLCHKLQVDMRANVLRKAWSSYMLTIHEVIKELYKTEPSWFRKNVKQKVKQVASELEHITEPTDSEENYSFDDQLADK